MSRFAAAIPRALVAVRHRSMALSPGTRFRLAGIAAVTLLLVLTYLLWFRDSGFVRVEKVEVQGLTAGNADRIEAALTDAARGMTTLHVRRDQLEQAVAAYPVVHAIEVSTDFPHGMTIRVIERRPVAILVSGEERLAVAGDGMVLRGLSVSGSLPEVEIDGGLPTRRVGDPDALRAVTVIGAAPAALGARIDEVIEEQARGLVVTLRDGPEVVLGDAGRLHAKWAAVARILADPAADGAAYVDVRMPDRPVAGGLPVTPEEGAAAPEAVAPAVPETTAPTVEAAPTTPETPIPEPVQPTTPNPQP